MAKGDPRNVVTDELRSRFRNIHRAEIIENSKLEQEVSVLREFSKDNLVGSIIRATFLSELDGDPKYMVIGEVAEVDVASIYDPSTRRDEFDLTIDLLGLRISIGEERELGPPSELGRLTVDFFLSDEFKILELPNSDHE